MKFKTQLKSKFLLKIGLLILMSNFFIAPKPILATGSLTVVSGTFIETKHRLIAGSQMDSKNSVIDIKNSSSQTVKMALTSDVSDGITLVFSQLPFELKAGTSIQIPIGIVVDSSTKGKDYIVKIFLETQRGEAPKEVLTLSSQVSVESAFGELTLQIVSPDQKPVLAKLELVRLVDGQSIGIRNIDNISNYSEKLVPGEYKAIITSGEVQTEFLINLKEASQTKKLIIETIHILDLQLAPIVDSSTKKVNSIKVNYVLDNLFDEKQKLKVKLLVYDQNQLIDEVDIAQFSTLSIGKSNQTFTYTSLETLKGQFTFEVKILDNSLIVLSSKKSDSLKINTDLVAEISKFLKPFIFFLGLISALYLVFDGFVSRRKSKGKTKKTTLPIFVEEIKIPDQGLPIPNPTLPVIVEKVKKEEAIVAPLEMDSSYLPSRLSFTGDINSQSDVVINGTVYGNVYSEKSIIVEASAKIIGKVVASNILIFGSIEGEVISRQDLVITKTGKVSGLINPKKLTIESGAELDVTIHGMRINTKDIH